MKRETVFLLGFGLRMSTEDVSDFLTRVLREQDFDFHNPEEVIYWYCYHNHLGYYKAEEYKKIYKELTPTEKKTGEVVYGTGLCLDSEEKLLEYLAFLKGRCDDPKSEKSQAFQEFMILLERARKIIAAMYQQDEEENGGKKIWKPENISASDLEKVICSGIPILSLIHI